MNMITDEDEALLKVFYSKNIRIRYELVYVAKSENLTCKKCGTGKIICAHTVFRTHRYDTNSSDTWHCFFHCCDNPDCNFKTTKQAKETFFSVYINCPYCTKRLIKIKRAEQREQKKQRRIMAKIQKEKEKIEEIG